MRSASAFVSALIKHPIATPLIAYVFICPVPLSRYFVFFISPILIERSESAERLPRQYEYAPRLPSCKNFVLFLRASISISSIMSSISRNVLISNVSPP